MEQRRRVAKKKKHDNRFPMVATTLQGLEEVLAKELSKIGGNDIKTAKRAVRFTADKDLVYKANLQLRTALRLLKTIKRFKARNEDELYKQVKSIDWTELFDIDKTFLIRATVGGSIFTNSHYASLKCKDAIVDLFRERFGSRPSIDSNDPNIVIHLKIWNDEIIISIDSSGQPLNKRGYRQARASAPLNECLAAGSLLLAGYEGKRNLVDGMTGSGTLAIEAAMIANNIAPGLLREEFSFMHWKDFDEDLYEIIHQATVNRIKENPLKVVGYEKEFRTINMAREAAETAGVHDMIDFRLGSFFDEDPEELPAILIMNPPYGERLKERNLLLLYERIGSKLKSDYSGYTAWILSSNKEAMHSIGLRSSETYHLMNGKLPCQFSAYKMYR